MAHGFDAPNDDFMIQSAIKDAIMKQIEKSGKFDKIKKKMKVILSKEVKDIV